MCDYINLAGEQCRNLTIVKKCCVCGAIRYKSHSDHYPWDKEIWCYDPEKISSYKASKDGRGSCCNLEKDTQLEFQFE